MGVAWARAVARHPNPPTARTGTVASVDDRWLQVSRSCRVPFAELEWHFDPAGGPGGQHANTASTRAEVRFDVEASQSLGPRQRARLLERLGPVVRVSASDTRSQARNRDLALERLRMRLADALRTPRPRRPSRPSRAAVARRLEAKRRRGERKRGRRPPAPDA